MFNVKMDLAREKDGGRRNILWWGECMSFRDLLPPLITLRRKGSLEYSPSPSSLPSPLLQFSLDTFTPLIVRR